LRGRRPCSRISSWPREHSGEALIAIDSEILLRIIALGIIAAAGAVLPISAAIREAWKPRDPKPLDIDNRYRKDDRYFATSFDALIERAVGPAPRPPGIHRVRLHDEESVKTIEGSLDLRPVDGPRSILDIHGDLRVESGATIAKEVLVGGSAKIGEAVRLRALKASGSIDLGPHVDIERWIDTGARLAAGDGCRLGARATAADEIILGADIQFNLLSAPCIVVGAEELQSCERLPAPSRPVAEFGDPKRCRPRADGALLTDGDFIIPDGANAAGDVIARGDIRIGRQATIRGSLHSDADVRIGEGAVITGSVYAERMLHLGENAVISEHALTAGSAIIDSGARVGSPGRITTLLADGFVELNAGVVLYGRIVSAHGGVTRAAQNTSVKAVAN